MPFSTIGRVFAISGASCTGKTSVARDLATLTGIQLRSCGDAVRERSTALGLTVATLPRSDHQWIDEETRRLARDPVRDVIIEGTYLDIVLAEVANVRLVRLVCKLEVRAARLMRRGGEHGRYVSLAERDELDRRIREDLYGSSCVMPMNPHAEIDTSALTIGECAAQVISVLGIGHYDQTK